MNDAKPTRLSETTPDPWLGKEINGYRIESVIGRGGMGVVYNATQLSLNRAVAIKVIPETFAEHPQFVERFHREVDVLSKLSHPNIVTVFERGEIDGRLYVVMEFVEGTSLRDVIKAGPLPKTEALSIVRSVLQALEHAHERGVVHRDIKPENVLVAPGGIVKVADFGLSRLLGPQDVTRLTHTHLLLGTFEYMAPEQREKAKEADERSDLYATGVVLYELLAGELPIGNFDPLSEKRPHECDARIDEIVSKSLQKTPEKRYQRAGEMGDAVSRLLSAAFAVPDEPKPAPEPPRERPVHGRKHHHRRRRSSWPAIVVACFFLGALLLAGVYVSLGFENVRSEDGLSLPEQRFEDRMAGDAPARQAKFHLGVAWVPRGMTEVPYAALQRQEVMDWVSKVGGTLPVPLSWHLSSRHLSMAFPHDFDRRRACAVTAAYQLLLENWWGVKTDRVEQLRKHGILGEFNMRAAANPLPEKTR